MFNGCLFSKGKIIWFDLILVKKFYEFVYFIESKCIVGKEKVSDFFCYFKYIKLIRFLFVFILNNYIL